MQYVARKALDTADQLWELVELIKQDDATTRATDPDGCGYISADELDVLDEAISVLQDYGRGRASRSLVDEYNAYR